MLHISYHRPFELRLQGRTSLFASFLLGMGLAICYDLVMIKAIMTIVLGFVTLSLTQCTVTQQAVHVPESPEEALEGHAKGLKRSSYTVRGVRYHPMTVDAALNYEEEGIASHYNGRGGKTAIGERAYNGDYNAAHRTLPLPCVVEVTNLANGKSCKLRVNDRGPFVKNRVIDVSAQAARDLGFYSKGLQRVKVKVLSVGDGEYRRFKAP